MTTSTLTFWRRVFDGECGYISVFSIDRAAGGKVREQFYPYPQAAGNAEAWLQSEQRAGRDVYAGAALFTDRKRAKASVGKVRATWADGDGATVPAHLPQPTLTVQTSPGRWNYYWLLSEAVTGEQVEDLNRRIAYAIGADKGGWDSTQLLRVPGFTNGKYEDRPVVEIVADDGPVYNPGDLDEALPEAPAYAAAASTEPIDTDEPPVPLEGRALEIHQGKHAPLTETGSVDRSRAAWQLACVYEEAGLTAAGLRVFVPLRVEALGWGKGEDYDRLIGKVMARPREPRAVLTTPAPPPMPAGGECGRCADLVQQRDHYRDLYERTVELQRNTMRVLANPHLKTEGRTALATTFYIAGALDGGRGGPDGFVHVPMVAIAERAGVSAKRAADHLKAIARRGVLELEHRITMRDVPNRDTGEIVTRPVPEVFVRALASMPDTLAALAELGPAEEEERASWGGRREDTPQCPDHPDAPVVKLPHCSDCRALLDTPRSSAPLSTQDGRVGTSPQPAALWGYLVGQDDGIGRARIKDVPDGLRECSVCRGPTAPTRSVCWNCQASASGAGSAQPLSEAMERA